MLRRLSWPILVALVCLPVVWLAAGFDIPGLRTPRASARPTSVPAGDQEIVWLHTTTSGSNWERLLAGLQRTVQQNPGLSVDVSQAYPEQTTSTPEVVIRNQNSTGALHLRWYKINSYVKTSSWVRALAERDPPPLAIIGGGSSDRARDLAYALREQTSWRGDRPLFFITTATAEKVHSELDENMPLGDSPTLLKIYPERSFRFSYGNYQMAEAMLDFVWKHPNLQPVPPNSKAVARILPVDWKDDP
ncbi:MAG: hypothetical protein ACRCZF_02085, partial [Gemmataceae bacterium]